MHFRPTTTGAIVGYKPEQLQKLCLASGRQFLYDIFLFDVYAETRTNQLTRGMRISQKYTPLFAEVLVEGPASLLRVERMGATHYFVRRETASYLELTERLYLGKNGVSVMNGNNYVGQLQLYFGDCAAAVQAAEHAPFTAEGLVRVVQAYNQQCSASHSLGSTPYSLTKPGTKMAWNVGVLGGIQFNSFALSNYDITSIASSLNGLNLDHRLHPVGGLYVDALHAGRVLALHSEATLNRFGSQQEFAASPTTSAGSYEWLGTQAQLRVGLRFFSALSQRKRQFFGGIGAGHSFTLSYKSSLKYGTASDSFLNGNDGFLCYLEAGVRQQRLTLTLTGQAAGTGYYEDTLGWQVRGNTHLLQYAGAMWSVSATLGYRLNTNTDARDSK